MALAVRAKDKTEEYILDYKENGKLEVDADCRIDHGFCRTSGNAVLNMDLDSIDCGLGSRVDEMVDRLNEGSFVCSYIDGGDGLEPRFAKGAGTAALARAE